MGSCGTDCQSTKPCTAPFHAHVRVLMVATAATSVRRLRTTPEVSVPLRFPKSRVLLRCSSQSA